MKGVREDPIGLSRNFNKVGRRRIKKSRNNDESCKRAKRFNDSKVFISISPPVIFCLSAWLFGVVFKTFFFSTLTY